MARVLTPMNVIKEWLTVEQAQDLVENYGHRYLTQDLKKAVEKVEIVEEKVTVKEKTNFKKAFKKANK